MAPAAARLPGRDRVRAPQRRARESTALCLCPLRLFSAGVYKVYRCPGWQMGAGVRRWHIPPPVGAGFSRLESSVHRCVEAGPGRAEAGEGALLAGRCGSATRVAGGLRQFQHAERLRPARDRKVPGGVGGHDNEGAYAGTPHMGSPRGVQVARPHMVLVTTSCRRSRRTGGGINGIEHLNRRNPGATPMTARKTSGARLEPPIPSRMTSETPLALIDSANARSRDRCGETIVDTSSQPRRLAICC